MIHSRRYTLHLFWIHLGRNLGGGGAIRGSALFLFRAHIRKSLHALMIHSLGLRLGGTRTLLRILLLNGTNAALDGGLRILERLQMLNMPFKKENIQKRSDDTDRGHHLYALQKRGGDHGCCCH